MYIQLVKKPPKLNEKTKRKTRDSIDEKLLELDEKIRRKTDLQEVKNLQNLVWKTGRKTKY